MRSEAPPDELSIRKALAAGMAHHDAGRLREAAAIYRTVLDSAPDRPEALVLLADVLQREGGDDDAIRLLERAVGVAPSVARFHHSLALALARRGRIDEAIRRFHAVLALEPASAEAYLGLGNALALSGRPEEAIASYRRAIAADPSQAAAHTNLGAVLYQLGRWDDSLVALRAALEIADVPLHRENFARVLLLARRLPADPGFAKLLARALSGAWGRPADLARPAISVLLADPELRPRIDAACAVKDGEAAAGDVEALAALSRHELLLALLASAQICEARIETFLTRARAELLRAALADRVAAPLLPFACALARQCFLNDYVFTETPAERADASALARRVEASIAAGDIVDAGKLAVLAAYTPLASLERAGSLLDREWPPAPGALLLQQVAEPREEREDRARVPVLTAVRDAVSQSVRRQYEENPYPRWTGLPPCEPVPFEAYLRAALPDTPPDCSSLGRPIELLVAGCGTGQESADIARRLGDAKVLAIDLSLASLCYARRMACGLGIANVEYAQADILEVESLGRTFDVISSVGVLHHLADPLAGWRALAACLRPGGFMQVGLYSEIARRDLAAARAVIAERGFDSTPEGIRDCRAALRADARFAGVTALRDFYGMNECRDLLFHVQEHRFTLPQVGEAAASLGLEILGFMVDAATRRRCSERVQGRAPDLADWDACEREFPDTFAGMYLFWMRKPAKA